MRNDLTYLDRFSIMLTDSQLKRLFNANIIVFGAGGVGSAVAQFLVRSGIQNLSVVDFDVVDITNVNRQLVANMQNVGKLKVVELKKQLKKINKNLRIKIFPVKYGADNFKDFSLTNYDYVVDCIDDIKAKQLLITEAKKLNVPIISAMGAGNRYQEIPNFEIADINKTSYDPIAKILRKFCANNGIKQLNVCYTKQKSVKINCKKIASVVYYPVSMACVITAFVVNEIIRSE